MTKIGDIIMLVLNTWNAQKSVADNIVAVVVAVSGAVSGSIAAAAHAVATKAEAGIANLAAGQAATVDSFTAPNGKRYSLVIVEDGGAAAQALGL